MNDEIWEVRIIVKGANGGNALASLVSSPAVADMMNAINLSIETMLVRPLPAEGDTVPVNLTEAELREMNPDAFRNRLAEE